jgi:hypothetical protein
MSVMMKELVMSEVASEKGYRKFQKIKKCNLNKNSTGVGCGPRRENKKVSKNLNKMIMADILKAYQTF